MPHVSSVWGSLLEVSFLVEMRLSQIVQFNSRAALGKDITQEGGCVLSGRPSVMTTQGE
jgi:hypothetical protein